MDKTKQLINSANAILKAVHELIDNMRPPLTSPARLRVALFLTIVEQFEAALHLESVGAATHGAVHVRSMLEALVAMNLLGQDSNYVYQMQFKQLHGEKKIYKGLLDDKNLSVLERQEIQLRLDDCIVRHDALCSKGHKNSDSRTMISEEIGKAGLSHLAVPYMMLCAFSHNDIAVLAYRHQGDRAMQTNAAVDPSVVVSIFSVAIQIMVIATEPLAEIALFPDRLFDRVFQEMNNVWGHVLDDIQKDI